MGFTDGSCHDAFESSQHVLIEENLAILKTWPIHFLRFLYYPEILGKLFCKYIQRNWEINNFCSLQEIGRRKRKSFFQNRMRINNFLFVDDFCNESDVFQIRKHSQNLPTLSSFQFSKRTILLMRRRRGEEIFCIGASENFARICLRRRCKSKTRGFG